MGIAAGTEEAVFEKFYQGAGAEAPNRPGGAGLGLTICRGIITAHGGRIWVLIIEHEPQMRRFLRATLRANG